VAAPRTVLPPDPEAIVTIALRRYNMGAAFGAGLVASEVQSHDLSRSWVALHSGEAMMINATFVRELMAELFKRRGAHALVLTGATPDFVIDEIMRVAPDYGAQDRIYRATPEQVQVVQHRLEFGGLG
jgi:hypothetical protein